VSRSPRPPEFFLDRNLGRLRVAAALRERGWIIRTHHDVFGRRDQQVADVEWLEYCWRENLPVLPSSRRVRTEVRSSTRFRSTDSRKSSPDEHDKVSLDLVWLRDDSLEDMENLPSPDVIAQEIVDDLEAALSEFAAIAESLRPNEQ
jgi:hypothetical protein